MKRVMFLMLIVLLAAGWYVTIDNFNSKPAEYKALLLKAQEYEGKGLYNRAIEYLMEAESYVSDENTTIQKAHDYLALLDTKKYTEIMTTVCETNGYRTDTTSELADFYISQGNNKKAIEILRKALDSDGTNEEFLSRFEKVRYTYSNLHLGYSQIHMIRNGSAVVEAEDKFGVIGKNGEVLLKITAQKAGPANESQTRIAASDTKTWYVLDINGNKREVPEKDQHVEYVGIFENGIAPALINGNWCYIDEYFHILSSDVWEYASVIYIGTGAVKKNGKWALISEDYQLLSDYIYDDVALDEYGYCSLSGRIFVKENGKYRIVDLSGTPVGTETYENVKTFVGGGPAAFERNGLWGFVDENGIEVISPTWTDAYSFASGLAPVKTENGWGYIDLEGNLRIEDGFDDALPFEKGYAPVKVGKNWSVIKLNVY